LSEQFPCDPLRLSSAHAKHVSPCSLHSLSSLSLTFRDSLRTLAASVVIAVPDSPVYALLHYFYGVKLRKVAVILQAHCLRYCFFVYFLVPSSNLTHGNPLCVCLDCASYQKRVCTCILSACIQVVARAPSHVERVIRV
jgi:hypothetical protein